MCDEIVNTRLYRDRSLRSIWQRGLPVVAMLLAGASASQAAVVSLSSPVSGAASAGLVIDVTVSLVPNGATTTDLVSHQFFVGATGLEVDGSSWGSAYAGLSPYDFATPSTGDVLDSSGPVDCSTPFACDGGLDAYDTAWMSSLVLLSPSVAANSGSLFTLRLRTIDGATPWAFSLFGDTDYSLLRTDLLEPIEFTIVSSKQSSARDVARVEVAYVASTHLPTPVPEPSVLVLGAAAWLATRWRRSVRV